MADITKTISDSFDLSESIEVSWLIAQTLTETISPSGVVPSGISESADDTISISDDVPASGFYKFEEVSEGISVPAAPSGTFSDRSQDMSDQIIVIAAPSGSPLPNESFSDDVVLNDLPMPSGSFSIGLPSDLASFYHGYEITFSGNGTDEEGDITTDNVVWYSDRDGIIGSGVYFRYDDLSVGTHIITVSSLAQGKFSTDIQIQVLENTVASRVEDVRDG